MCGIFAYLNFDVSRERRYILEVLFNGLRRLEYRGYDSAGISIDSSAHSNCGVTPPPIVFRQAGNIESLIKSVYQGEFHSPVLTFCCCSCCCLIWMGVEFFYCWFCNHLSVNLLALGAYRRNSKLLIVQCGIIWICRCHCTAIFVRGSKGFWLTYIYVVSCVFFTVRGGESVQFKPFFLK